MNCRGVRRHQHVELSKSVSDTSAVKARNEPEPLGDASLHQFDDVADGGLWIVCRHEVEIALGAGGLRSGSEPWLIRWALVMMRLCAACRNTSVSRTTCTASDEITSAST